LLASVVGAEAVAPVESSPRPALLGRGEAYLREEIGDALRPEPIEQRPAQFVPTTATKDTFAEQQRFVWDPTDGDVRRIEYELFRSKIYRVRWQLAGRFERPIMDSLVTHLTAPLGKPYYDQRIEAKFGTGRATLRRAAWRNGPRVLEVRQLNPLVGGPLYLTLSDQAAIQSIVGSGGTAAPEPDSIGRWWSEPIEPFKSLTTSERDALLVGFDAVLALVDWKQ